MSHALAENSTVVRTERGLSIAGTRITLYTILDYLHAGWSPKLIQQWFGLSEYQIDGVLGYIDAHRDVVEQEYQELLKQAEQNRRYWDEHNRKRQAAQPRTDLGPPDPRRAKLEAWKKRAGVE